jgi:FtsP/CotA-like multicopper oxidase with cupredoxin domain
MMRCFVILFLLVSCTSNRSKPVKNEPTPSRPSLLRQPLEAEDLDPDPQVLHVALSAQIKNHEIDGKTIEGFAYNDQLPGPLLRVKLGDTLRVDLTNNLGTATTIHWHGVHVPYDMDGVTWQKDPVAPGESFTYEFKLTQTGTYWYHPHFNTARQVDLGLYGVLIVEDPTDPKLDTELVLVFDGMEENAGDPVDEEGAEDSHPEGHLHKPIAKWLVNGEYQPTVTLKGGTRVRVRMLNASNSGYVDLRMPDIRHVAGDQGRLAAPAHPNQIILAPGDRADVVWLVGKEGFELRTAPYFLGGGKGLRDAAPKWSKVQTLLTVKVESPAPAPAPANWEWSNIKPSIDPTYTDIVYVFSGSPDSGKWLINGESFPDVTVEEVPLGAARIIEVRNLSPTEHPFHLHGHGFELLSVNGVQPEFLTMEDTINVPIRARVRLRLVADNPGDWMTHCHILPHADEGMMTVLRVLDK